jgi:precorrin-8X/cobalt-precorrin-8 methylmutase
MKPNDIETLSFQIIDREAGPHGFSPEQWEIVRRMIHTSADFDYMHTVYFHPRAVDQAREALRRGCRIVTDTHMAMAGIRKNDLEKLGATVRCLIADPAVAAKAEVQETTRAEAAVEQAAGAMDGGIWVVGNAPTALLRLVTLIGNQQIRPALVVGLPVGFVNAAESKQALRQTGAVCITNTGRKGGSNVAAAAVNALIKMALR